MGNTPDKIKVVVDYGKEDEEHEMEVSKETTIKTIKKKMKKVSGIKPKDQHLRYMNRIASDEQPVKDFYKEYKKAAVLKLYRKHKNITITVASLEETAQEANNDENKEAENTGETEKVEENAEENKPVEVKPSRKSRSFRLSWKSKKNIAPVVEGPETFPLTITNPAEATINEFKQVIATRGNVSVEGMKLTYDGTTLFDERTLEFYIPTETAEISFTRYDEGIVPVFCITAARKVICCEETRETAVGELRDKIAEKQHLDKSSVILKIGNEVKTEAEPGKDQEVKLEEKELNEEATIGELIQDNQNYLKINVSLLTGTQLRELKEAEAKKKKLAEIKAGVRNGAEEDEEEEDEEEEEEQQEAEVDAEEDQKQDQPPGHKPSNTEVV